MDLKTVLQSVTSLSAERKEYLLSQYSAGVLTSDEREELARHLTKFAVAHECDGVVEQLLR